MFYRFLFLLSSLVIHTSINAQRWTDDQLGIQVGISSTFGTHINNIGIKVQAYYTHNHFQVNSGGSFHFNLTNYGERKKYIESRINTGIVLMGGKEDITPHFMLDGLTFQSEHRYALAYNYLWYLDNIGTSQRSGGMGLHIQNYSFFIENDFFAGQGRDRFRTNSALITYRTEEFLFKIDTKLWTGETRGADRISKNTNDYPVGYKDLRNTPFGKTSHGILAIGVDYLTIYGNTLNIGIGLDSERIRNSFQNKLMHDKKFTPKRWRKENAHYPMLDKNGYPITDSNIIRPTKIYIQGGLNSSLFY